MISKEELLYRAKKCQEYLDNCVDLISTLYPELGIITTGSIYHNSFEIAIDEKVAFKILNGKEFKDFKEKGIGRL